MPGFNYTNVDCNQIEKVINDFKLDIEKLFVIHTIMNEEVMVDIDTSWEGPAKLNFEQMLNRFNSNFKWLADEYKNIHELLQNIDLTYNKADESAKQKVANLLK